MELLTVAILAGLFAAPLILGRYLRQLPIAPACPRCHSMARQIDIISRWLDWIPAFGRTFLAECGRCGWHGRMRWRWARVAELEGRG